MKFKPNHYIIGGKKLPENKFLDLKRDIVFQRLFGSQKNAAITGHLLSLILKRDISNLDLDVNKRMMGKNINIKVGRLDIRAKFNNGEECNIEMQVAPYDFMPQRMLDYWADMYANKIKIGQDYGVLKPTISILIANYKIKELKEIPKYHTKWALKEEDYKDIVLIKDLEFHILEIPKVLKNQTLKNDELAIWLKFIENPEDEEVQKEMEENKFLKQAQRELAYLSEDPDFQYLVDDRVRFLRDNYSYKQQIKRGEKKKIAIRMLTLKMPIEQIMKITELSKDEIFELQKEMKN